MSEILESNDQKIKRFTKKELLSVTMTPDILAGHFVYLEKAGQLQEFLEEALLDEDLSAKISYWEKWLKKDHDKLVDQIIAKKKKIYPGEKEGLPLSLEKKFTEEELSLIVGNIFSIQLTFGCSKGCPFCGFDALPGVREHLSYAQLVNLFEKYKDVISKDILLYWASEPSDYEFEDKSYQDIHQLVQTYLGRKPHVTSNKFNDSQWLKFLSEESSDPRISLFGLSPDKAAKITTEIPEQILMLGKEKSHQNGIGISFLESRNMYGKQGIGCYDGTLLTPRGLYNIVQVPISAHFPQGQVVQPLESVSNKDVKVGDDFFELLKTSIVKNQLRVNRKKFLQEIPISFVTITGTYYVAIDEDYKVAAVKTPEELSDYLKAYSNYSKQLEEVAKFSRQKRLLADHEGQDSEIVNQHYFFSKDRAEELRQKVIMESKKQKSFFEKNKIFNHYRE